jgi:hypothetical protein
MRPKRFAARSAFEETSMRRKRELETEEQRHERFGRDVQRRSQDAVTEGKEMDAQVQRSIKLYGA